MNLEELQDKPREERTAIEQCIVDAARLEDMRDGDMELMEKAIEELDGYRSLVTTLPWRRCNYVKFDDTTMPEIDRLVLIQVFLDKSPNMFLSVYKGDGQFRIETKAELQDNGTHRKFTSAMHASFVTHWVYITEPE